MKRDDLIPIVPAVAVLVGLALFWRNLDSSNVERDRASRAAEQGSRDARSGADLSSDVGGGSRPPRKRDLIPPGPESRAEDFPHNLKTFDDWGSISAAEMETYRVSLIARVGHWDAAEVEEFFFRASPEITDPAALRSFRESVLGVWCAKDVDPCLDQLVERLDAALVSGARQDALAGWAREDWLTALRFLQRTGDEVIEAQLGGDSSRFVKNLISEVARANGIVNAAEVASLLKSVNNQSAANVAIEEAKKEPKQR